MGNSFSTTPAAAAPTSATGFYADQSDIENIFSASMVAQWSDMESAGVVNVARVQLALDNADAEINAFFNDGPFTTPLSLGTAGGVLATRWGATLAGTWLYLNRGVWDEDKMADQMETKRNGIMREMGLYKGGVLRLDAARRWGGLATTAPAAV